MVLQFVSFPHTFIFLLPLLVFLFDTFKYFGRPLTSVIGEVGGIKLCFPFLDMGPAQQVAGLRILVGLLAHSETNKAQFRKLHGFCILYYLLCRFELSMETYLKYIYLCCKTKTCWWQTTCPLPIFYEENTLLLTISDYYSTFITIHRFYIPPLTISRFDVVFDLLHDGSAASHSPTPHLPTPEWAHDGLTLVLDLLTSSSCNDELQRRITLFFFLFTFTIILLLFLTGLDVLKCMTRMVGTSSEALRLWTSGRLFSMLNLITKLTTGIWFTHVFFNFFFD